MKYRTYKVVGGGTITREICETDEERAQAHADAIAGKTEIGDVWDRKEREAAYKYGLKLEAEKKAAEEEARRKAEGEKKPE